MSYGFRMYRFAVHEGFRRTPRDLNEKVGNETVPELLERLLGGLTVAPETLVAMPALRQTADGDDVSPETPQQRGDRAVKWLDWARPGSLHFTVSVRYGSVDGHDLAIGPSADVDILGTAPTHKYRADILLPKAGDAGLIIAEDIDRSCPGPAIAQWISRQSKDTADGEIWWRFRPQALSDDKRLTELIQNSKKAEIRLKREGKTESGKRYKNPLTITAELDRSDERDLLLTEAKKWLAGDKKAKSESVGVLAEIAGVEGLEPDEADVHLTDAKTGHRIKPWRIDDVFVYPTGDSRATPEKWKSEVMARLSVLSGSLGFDVEW